tara:strand:+ start:911 stop:1294 length:384 start_codon:yes stop_codon:yes gene_type:complete
MHDNSIVVPKKMYHATYNYYLESILAFGLMSKPENRNFEFSRDETVCLAFESGFAESCTENSDTAEEREEEQNYTDVSIVVIEIDTTLLDKRKFMNDRNMRDNGISLEYNGIIPPTSMKIIRKVRML